MDEDPAAPTAGLVVEVTSALNEAQSIIALLSLCLEKTATFPLTAATCWFNPRSVLTDLIVPLRLMVGAVTLRPASVPELEALNTAWQATAGATARYASLGCNLLAVTPQAAAGSTANVTYAYSPALLIDDTDTPEIPVAYHLDLVKFAVWRVKLKEGAQALERGARYFGEFLADVKELASHVRARSLARGLDFQPPEATLFDRSRILPK